MDATNHFVQQAQGAGLLAGRIPREFECYWPDKHREHDAYPAIDVARCTTFGPTTLKYVANRIMTIADNEGLDGETRDLPFIVIGPESGYHLDQVKEHLLSHLDTERFEVVDSRREGKEMEVQEGYALIVDGKKNLGWRIVLHIDPLPEVAEIIRQTYESDVEIESLLPDEYKRKHLSAIEAQEDIEVAEEEEKPKKVKILLTNYFGSKGLSALHAIVVGLNNYDFPSNPAAIQDSEVCKFLVALTRGKNSCALVTNRVWDRRIKRSVERPSIFLSWLPQSKLSSRNYRATDFT